MSTSLLLFEHLRHGLVGRVAILTAQNIDLGRLRGDDQDTGMLAAAHICACHLA